MGQDRYTITLKGLSLEEIVDMQDTYRVISALARDIAEEKRSLMGEKKPDEVNLARPGELVYRFRLVDVHLGPPVGKIRDDFGVLHTLQATKKTKKKR